jgi:hypothetical protein
MKLYEHPDFEQAILRAAEHFRGRGLRPAVIEKDYYVTEALRIISVTAGDKVIFKGGTSLSKDSLLHVKHFRWGRFGFSRHGGSIPPMSVGAKRGSPRPAPGSSSG